jgi:hypothetical protein
VTQSSRWTEPSFLATVTAIAIPVLTGSTAYWDSATTEPVAWLAASRSPRVITSTEKEDEGEAANGSQPEARQNKDVPNAEPEDVLLPSDTNSTIADLNSLRIQPGFRRYYVQNYGPGTLTNVALVIHIPGQCPSEDDLENGDVAVSVKGSHMASAPVQMPNGDDCRYTVRTEKLVKGGWFWVDLTCHVSEWPADLSVALTSPDHTGLTVGDFPPEITPRWSHGVMIGATIVSFIAIAWLIWLQKSRAEQRVAALEEKHDEKVKRLRKKCEEDAEEAKAAGFAEAYQVAQKTKARIPRDGKEESDQYEKMLPPQPPKKIERHDDD